jgi:hypothetical protein
MVGNDFPARAKDARLIAPIGFLSTILTEPVTAGSELPLFLRNIATGRASVIVMVNAVGSGLFVLIDGIERDYFWHG